MPQLYEIAEIRERRTVTLAASWRYRSPLEARIAKKTTKAIKDFNLD